MGKEKEINQVTRNKVKQILKEEIKNELLDKEKLNEEKGCRAHKGNDGDA